MAELPPSTANLRTPERFLAYSPLLGLQGRLSLGGEALLPSKNVELKKEKIDISNFGTTDALLVKASIKERSAYWATQTEQSKDAQLTIWKNSIVEKITALPQSTIGTEHAEFFTKIGIDAAHFTVENAQTLYDKYFSKEHAKDGFKLFLNDVAVAYKTADGKVDMSVLENHLAAVQWMAGMFGKNSSEIITQYFDAATRYTADEDAFVAARKDKVNTLSNHEVELLTFLTEGTTPEATPTPVPPVKKPEKTPPPQTPIHIEPKKEPVKADADPWAHIPRPKSPIRIREGKVERDSAGKRTGEEAQVDLIIGTDQHPLVARHTWANGSSEIVRRTVPERPFNIPAIVYLDGDITPEQKNLLQQNLPHIYQELGIPYEFVQFSDSPDSKFTTSMKTRNNNGGLQYNSDDIFTQIREDENQITKPHHALIFTNKDLFASGTNFVVGSAVSDLGTIISFNRVWTQIKDRKTRDQTLLTEIAHEVGHVYNLPSGRRGQDKLEQSLGAHCKNQGCCMKQGLNVPADFIRMTQDRIHHLGHDHYYCADCKQDLQAKFTNPKT